MRRFLFTGGKSLQILRLLLPRFHGTDSKENIPPAEKSEHASAECGDSEEYQKLFKELEHLKAEIGSTKQEILYTAATADNIRKECNGEKNNVLASVKTTFALDMLEIVDILEKTCVDITSYRKVNDNISQNVLSLLDGVELSHKVIATVLRRHGVSAFDGNVGDKFDPLTQTSLFTSPASASVAAGYVTELVKRGYMKDGNVLRKAEVGVAESSE